MNRRSFPVLALAVLGGCAAIKPALAPVTMRLAPAAPTLAAGGLKPVAVAVSTVASRGLAGGLRYAYIDAAAPAEIRLASTLFWEESPSRVLERALVAQLRVHFRSVAGPDIGAPADRRIVARLDRFEETGAGGDARAVVAFDATLVGDVRSHGSYCAAVSVPSAVPSARAAAFDAAIAQATAKFAGDAAGGVLSSSSC